jgi:putative ribosome biogenesis GTPase RsgA
MRLKLLSHQRQQHCLLDAVVGQRRKIAELTRTSQIGRETERTRQHFAVTSGGSAVHTPELRRTVP